MYGCWTPGHKSYLNLLASSFTGVLKPSSSPELKRPSSANMSSVDSEAWMSDTMTSSMNSTTSAMLFDNVPQPKGNKSYSIIMFCFGLSIRKLSDIRVIVMKIQKQIIFESRREKTGFLHMRTAKLISVFVFATRIAQSPYYINPKLQASSYLLWLYSLVCVDLVGNPEDRFSQNEAHLKDQ